MIHVPLLPEIAIMGWLAVAVSALLRERHLPVVAGFLPSGAPHDRWSLASSTGWRRAGDPDDPGTRPGGGAGPDG